MAIIDFNPTYNEMYEILEQLRYAMDIYYDKCVKAKTSEELSENYDNYEEARNKYLLFNKAVDYSIMTSKIRKFDNKTLSDMQIELEKLECKRDILLEVIEEPEGSTAKEFAMDNIDEVMERIAGLKVDIQYIEANYKVNIAN